MTAPEGIDRPLFEVFLVYLLSGDRPIAEMFSPRLTPLARAFNAEFSGMTLLSVTPDDQLQNIARMAPEKRNAAIARLEKVLSGGDLTRHD